MDSPNTTALPEWGAHFLADGSVRFRLWAPACSHVDLIVDGHEEPLRLRAVRNGWHELITARVNAGARYLYRLPDGSLVPDPASRFQPEDVEGPSELIDGAPYSWRSIGWRGLPWHTAVVYELHVGTFSSEGTFRGVIEHLPHLVDLGVTAIELMPIADFPGRFNWGYDGVLPYAPESSYGSPEDLKALVDAAHEKGLMVLLDVVYNHFGPQGNFLSQYAPQFFTDRHRTPWGAAINFDGKDSRPVRDFFIQNALYWLEEFRLDGLRLDAVHHLIDDSQLHILDELAQSVRSRFADRHIHLILENEENQASRLERNASGEPRTFTAQWNDDVHHVLHTALTSERHGYYGDYQGDDVMLARAFAEGFAFQGQVMKCRGRERGQPSAHLPPDAFVSFLQNHDQIGNRAFGERIAELASPEAVRAASAIYLLLPQVPMLFMGEEWAARNPFVFFCDFKGDLAKAIREGRRKEFAAFPQFSEAHPGQSIPDPDNPSSFQAAKLDWPAAGLPSAQQWLQRYRQLLEVRRREIIPRIPMIASGSGRAEHLGPAAVRVTWRVGEAEELVLIANLGPRSISLPQGQLRRLWSEKIGADRNTYEPWAVLWGIQPR